MIHYLPAVRGLAALLAWGFIALLVGFGLAFVLMAR
jgi:hypothetical protein